MVLRAAKTSSDTNLGSALREKMLSMGHLDEAPARVFRDALETLASL